jgi:dual specificity protein kinase YAK1
MSRMPPQSMLNTGKQTSQFFDSYEVWNPQTSQNEKRYRLKTLEQYSREHNTNEQPGKQYFKANSLPEIINTAPMPTFKSPSRQGHEMEKGVLFLALCIAMSSQARVCPFRTE